MTRLLDGLSEVGGAYDVLLCDIWGVIHDGVRPFAEACEALSRWRSQYGPVVLISNSPRPTAQVVEQLDAIGAPRAAWSAIATSGDATRDLLAERAPGPAWRIGPARDDPLFEGLGLAFAGPEEAAFIACTGPTDDEVETPEDYRAQLMAAVARGLEMVCANPDRVVQRGDRLIYCGGALAELYKELGGMAVMAGKPFAPLYELALAKAGEVLGRDVDPARTLAIGDGVLTDMLGAQMQDLDALFIASGINGAAALASDGKPSLWAIDAMLDLEGVRARFAMGSLAW